MRITNKYNLPKAIVSSAEKDSHVMADFSVTQMLKGATEIALGRVYGDQLQMDASECINMMFGRAVHALFEEQESEGVLNEHYMTARSFAGFTVSGTADVIDTIARKIKDYKTCSSWKVIYKDYDDWKEQLKAYLYLWYTETGEVYKDAEIVALIKDHSPTNAERDASYPQSPIITVGFTYTYEEIMGVGEMWDQKIRQVLKMLGTEEFGVCSESERWAKPATWAVMKAGRQSAVKVCATQEDAVNYCDSNGFALGEGKPYSIVHRKGEDTKCMKYCVVGKCGFCPYRNEITKGAEDGTENS